MRQVSVLPARGVVYRENDYLPNGLKVCNKVQKCKVILFILCLCGEFIRPSCFPKSTLIAQEAFFTWNMYSFSLGNCCRKLQSRAREVTQPGKCLPCKQKDLSSTPMTHIFLKKASMVVHACNPSTGHERDMQIPGTHGPSCLTQLVSKRPARGPWLLQKKKKQKQKPR